jgi:cyanate permease
MNDIVLEVIRAAILLYLLIYLIKAGTKRRELCRKGWGFIVAGFGLLLFANVMDITDNFESLNRFVVIGDTQVQAFLEKMIGFMGGFALLAVGLIRWIPTITGVEYDKQINKELKKEITKRKQAELLIKKERDFAEAIVNNKINLIFFIVH